MTSVCLVNGVFPPHEYGGAENYVLRVASALQERNYDVSVLTTRPYDGRSSLTLQREEYDGVTVYRFYPANFSHRSEGTGGNVVTKAMWHQLDTLNPHASRTVVRFLARERPDVVHTNNFMGISAGVGRAIAQSEAGYVHMLHDYSLLCPKSNLLRERTLPGDEIAVCHDSPAPCRLYASAKRRAIGRPDLVLAPSQHVIDVHRERGFFDGIPATRVQHGVTEVADEASSDPPERAVLYVGKHLRAKGLETLFAAAEELPDVTIHLCGTGPYDDESEAAQRKHDSIEYHGFVSDERLRELRRSVAAAVVPSIWMENSPLVVYESFAAGLPVIGADIGGIPELVTGDRGALFPPGDHEALASCIRNVLDDRRQHAAMRRNALAWAEDHTLSTHVERLIECYDAVSNCTH